MLPSLIHVAGAAICTALYLAMPSTAVAACIAFNAGAAFAYFAVWKA